MNAITERMLLEHLLRLPTELLAMVLFDAIGCELVDADTLGVVIDIYCHRMGRITMPDSMVIA